MKPTYVVAWSAEDSQYVAIVVGQPYLSWLDDDPAKALQGLLRVLNDE